MSRLDPHSFADLNQGVVRHLHLELEVDFSARRLAGSARLELAEPAAGMLDLDTNGIVVERISDDAGRELTFELGGLDAILGRRLRIRRESPTSVVTIHYATSSSAPALMWLQPSQTAGELPFVLTQCQPIHARSVVPLQDTPRVRVTYTAQIRTPAGMSAVMSAAPGETKQADDGSRVQVFSMPQRIPPYLLALAAGDLAHRDLGPRTRVYAEPSVVDAAAWEFADVEQMLAAAERLFGPYEWQRFDFVVLPPSFPLGGMENPRMTFLTPTLIAGDRSLVSVLAHELAHSWTGNLVTNASNEHFWLNEGWTMYAERRIIEALYGEEEAVQSALLGRHGLDRVMAERSAAGASTALSYPQSGIDPDEDFSILPYEKGFLLVVALEQAVGRERFDVFVRAYIDRFRFTSITSSQFAAFVRQQLPEAAHVDLDSWIHDEGLRDDAPAFHSARLHAIEDIARSWGGQPVELSGWSTNHKLHLLAHLPSDLDADAIAGVGEALGSNRNAEIESAWLARAAAVSVPGIEPLLRQFLGTVGRTKLVVPVVKAMVAGETLRPLARELVDDNLPRLHRSTAGVLRSLIG